MTVLLWRYRRQKTAPEFVPTRFFRSYNSAVELKLGRFFGGGLWNACALGSRYSAESKCRAGK
jgi:hypothetical protein